MLEEAVTRGLWDSDDLILDPVTDHLMRSKLRDAISGRVPSSGLTDAFDGMITSLLHHAFFGPGASKQWVSFTISFKRHDFQEQQTGSPPML